MNAGNLDYASVGGTNTDSNGYQALEQEANFTNQNASIEAIEKTLYDISGLFKRFGTIVT